MMHKCRTTVDPNVLYSEQAGFKSPYEQHLDIRRTRIVHLQCNFRFHDCFHPEEIGRQLLKLISHTLAIQEGSNM